MPRLQTEFKFILNSFLLLVEMTLHLDCVWNKLIPLRTFTPVWWATFLWYLNVCMLFFPYLKNTWHLFLPCLDLSLWCINCRHPQGVISSLPLLWPFWNQQSLDSNTHAHARTHTSVRLHLVFSPDVGSLQMVMGTDKSHSDRGRARVCPCQEGYGKKIEKRSRNWLKNQMFPRNRCSFFSPPPSVTPSSSSPVFLRGKVILSSQPPMQVNQHFKQAICCKLPLSSAFF